MARRRKRKKKGNGIDFAFIGQMFGSVGDFLLMHSGVIVMGIVFIVLFFTIQHYCHASALFSVSSINVPNLSNVSREKIVTLTDIHPGENIFSVDIKKAAKCLEALPRIKRAVVRRILPDVIDIALEERREVAQVTLPFRKQHYLLDREGYVLDPVLRVPREDLVVFDVQSSDKKTLQPGSFFYNAAIEKAFQLVALIEQYAIVPQNAIVAVRIDTSDNLTVVLQDDIEIRIGKNVEGLRANGSALKEILSDTMRASIAYIDVRFKDIVVKKK